MLNNTGDSMTQGIYNNLLHSENSAYLQQHKDDPVHWQSYHEKTLERARQEGKPIFYRSVTPLVTGAMSWRKSHFKIKKLLII
jgi:hypothetical protein